MSYQIGDRVGALISEDDSTVNFLGFGVYNGRKPCPLIGGVENPHITLDNGDVVWGCQVWWGDEARFKALIAAKVAAGKTIKDVRIADYANKA